MVRGRFADPYPETYPATFTDAYGTRTAASFSHRIRSAEWDGETFKLNASRFTCIVVGQAGKGNTLYGRQPVPSASACEAGCSTQVEGFRRTRPAR